MKRIVACIAFVVAALPAFAQQHKMSPFIRQIASSSPLAEASSREQGTRGESRVRDRQVCAFVEIDRSEASRVFRANGCRSVAQWGDIHIAMIPASRLQSLASSPAVRRIEARRSCKALLDSTAMHVNALPVYQGTNLPQAYTGRGVVVGVMDIGFDVTHPNFYSSDLSRYRIHSFWDQLSPDTVGSSLPVGADYVGRDAVLAYAHSFDAPIHSHGTHTLGIAAGSGFNSPYRGMAWESDICLVSNVTTEDLELIDSVDLYKYTSATDALGFKYIMDYADRVNQPCVISFSEGAPQSFSDEDRLFYAVLDSLTGPGRIIVAAAGNSGGEESYFRKPRGKASAGLYVFNLDTTVGYAMKGDAPFTLRTVFYSEQPDTLLVSTDQLFAEDGTPLPEPFTYTSSGLKLTAVGYRSWYVPGELAIEVSVEKESGWIGLSPEISVEALGENADVEFFMQDGYTAAGENYGVKLADGDPTHNIHSPGSAPSVICVGATGYRTGFYNFEGVWHDFAQGTHGERSPYSSVGPTVDGRIKPDVLAPGTNLISSYSSYYYEARPTARDIYSTVEFFSHQGRTYLWTSDAGTSMATPVVAGAIALWLQAKPDLSPEQALEVIARTSRQYDASLTYPNIAYGHGEIDVYQGLLSVLQLDLIDGISHHQPRSVGVAVAGDGQLSLHFSEPTATPVRVSLYSLSGRRVFTATVHPCGDAAVRVELPQLPHGVYAVQTDGSAAFTGSSLVRL